MLVMFCAGFGLGIVLAFGVTGLVNVLMSDEQHAQAFPRAYRRGFDVGNNIGYARGLAHRTYADLGLQEFDPDKGGVVSFPSIQNIELVLKSGGFWEQEAKHQAFLDEQKHEALDSLPYTDDQSDVQPEPRSLDYTPEAAEAAHDAENCKTCLGLCTWCGKLTSNHAASTLRRHRKKTKGSPEFLYFKSVTEGGQARAQSSGE